MSLIFLQALSGNPFVVGFYLSLVSQAYWCHRHHKLGFPASPAGRKLAHLPGPMKSFKTKHTWRPYTPPALPSSSPLKHFVGQDS